MSGSLAVFPTDYLLSTTYQDLLDETGFLILRYAVFKVLNLPA
jgi:hypothetical protein